MGRVVCANIKMSDIRAPGNLCEQLKKLGAPATATLFGDFWDAESLALVRKEFPGIVIYNYMFDGTVIDPAGMAEPLRITPSRFVIQRAHEFLGASYVVDFAAQSCARVLDLIDARCQARRVAETQEFVTGLCNIESGDFTLEERIFGVLRGQYQLDDVLKVGRSIVRSQIEIARKWAVENSRRGELKDGTTYAVTEAPVFCNMTHEELHERYPDVKITVTTSLKFAQGAPDDIAHSLRSWSSDVDVKKIVAPLGGGGAPNAAGTRRTVDVRIDY